ncbi:hypothetical protein ABIA35_009830, partial [Catenulispora sp. MAP12-49]|uniref:hypothetical protein n=1 Tax=Catenulispora sp. MAP12-49 TaxID=3156302 RepID=UPI0035188A67
TAASTAPDDGSHPTAGTIFPAQRLCSVKQQTLKACLKSSADGSPVGFSWKDWSLLFGDDTTAEPLNAWSPRDFSSALYPNDDTKAVPVGECRSGLIPFDVPAAQSGDPVKVVYSVNGQTLEWNR